MGGGPEGHRGMSTKSKHTDLVLDLSRDDLDFLEDELQFSLECGATRRRRQNGRGAVRRRRFLGELHGSADLDARQCDRLINNVA